MKRQWGSRRDTRKTLTGDTRKIFVSNIRPSTSPTRRWSHSLLIHSEPVRLASSSPFLRSKQIERVQKVKNGQLDKILVKIIS